MTLPPINPQNIARAFNEPTAEDWKERFAAVNAYIRTQIHIDLAGKSPKGWTFRRNSALMAFISIRPVRN